MPEQRRDTANREVRRDFFMRDSSFMVFNIAKFVNHRADSLKGTPSYCSFYLRLILIINTTIFHFEKKL